MGFAQPAAGCSAAEAEAGRSRGAQLSLELGGGEARAGGEPVARGELEVAIARPVRDDADQVAEVRLRIEPVEPSRGDQTSHSRRPGVEPSLLL